MLGLGLAIIASVMFSDDATRAKLVPIEEPEDPAADRETVAAEAERTATWQTYHCNLLHRYYDGPEEVLPIAELLGFADGENDEAVKARCREFLAPVQRMGGWPSGQPQQDNFVVCAGFAFVLRGMVPLSVAPDPDDLKSGYVAYGTPGAWTRTQRLVSGHPVRLGHYAVRITQANDRCVIVAAERSGRRRDIPGSIVRVQ